MDKLTRDEVSVYIFALRYAMMWRRTYALSLVTDCIEKHIMDFSDFDLRQAIQESEQVLEINDMKKIIDDCDADVYKRLQRICRKKLGRRSERENAQSGMAQVRQ